MSLIWTRPYPRHREARWHPMATVAFMLAGSMILWRLLARMAVHGLGFDTFDYLTMAGILGCALWVFVKGERFR